MSWYPVQNTLSFFRKGHREISLVLAILVAPSDFLLYSIVHAAVVAQNFIQRL